MKGCIVIFFFSMNILPMLSGEIQRSIDELGTPMPVMGEHERILMLVEPVFTYDALHGYSARLPGINAIGDGETKGEAALALREALRNYVRAFDDEVSS